MNKIQIATELSKNSTFFNDMLKSYLHWLVTGENLDDLDFNLDYETINEIMEYIEKDGFDITGFRIEEIPHECVIDFIKDDIECFDIYLHNFNGNGKEMTAGYIDEKSNTKDANNIKDAIERYCVDALQ